MLNLWAIIRLILFIEIVPYYADSHVASGRKLDACGMVIPDKLKMRRSSNAEFIVQGDPRKPYQWLGRVTNHVVRRHLETASFIYLNCTEIASLIIGGNMRTGQEGGIRP